MPDLRQGQTISFRMIDAKLGAGIPPERVRQVEPDEAAEIRKLAPILMRKALAEQAEEKQQARGIRRKNPKRK